MAGLGFSGFEVSGWDSWIQGPGPRVSESAVPGVGFVLCMSMLRATAGGILCVGLFMSRSLSSSQRFQEPE